MSASNTAHGIYEIDRYVIFDALPPPVRRALAHADYDWCIGSFAQHFQQHGIAETVAEIHRADRDEHARVARRQRRTVFDSRGRPVRRR